MGFLYFVVFFQEQKGLSLNLTRTSLHCYLILFQVSILHYCCSGLFWSKHVACMEGKGGVFYIGTVVNVDILLFNLLSISHILSK